MPNPRMVALIATLIVGACACPRPSRPRCPQYARPGPLPIAAAEHPHSPALTLNTPVAEANPGQPGTASVLLTVRLPVRAGQFDPIHVRWATHAPGSGARKTAAAGVKTVRLRGLPAGRVWVKVAVPKGPDDAYAAAAWLELEADQRTDIAFDFDRGHSVTGHLIDKHGRPVVNRRISFGEPTEPPLDMMIASTRTDSRGNFRIDGLPRSPGTLVIFIPQHPEGIHTQAVAFQSQAVEDVTPGAPPQVIVVREFDPEGLTQFGIGGGG